MTTQIEAMKMALIALEDYPQHTRDTPQEEAIAALRTAIEAAEKMEQNAFVYHGRFSFAHIHENERALYLHPPSAEIDELRKDAERYRAVVANLNSTTFMAKLFDGLGIDASKITKEMFDAEVDAAMREKQP